MKQSAAASSKQSSDRDKMIYNFKAKQKGKKRHYAPTLSERLQVVPEYCRIHTKSQRIVSSSTAKQVEQLQSTIKVE